MLGPQVLAHAIADLGKFPCPADQIPFIVTCWGELLGGDQLPRRKYQIAAYTDDIAARAGLERYVTEMERLN